MEHLTKYIIEIPILCLKGKIKISNKSEIRCEQGSNLRGETPLDFESHALTSRPSQLRELCRKQYIHQYSGEPRPCVPDKAAKVTLNVALLCRAPAHNTHR